MARFCPLEEVPQPVIDHVRRCLGLAAEVEPDDGAARTMRWHRAQVRKRLGATRDMRRARALAEAAIREAALVRNHPPDLINIALERIIEASLELPAYSTLDDLATTIRAGVNEAVFTGIVARMGPEGQLRALGLLATAESDGRSMFKLRSAHLDAAAVLDAGYEDNAGLVIGDGGTPSPQAAPRRGHPGIG